MPEHEAHSLEGARLVVDAVNDQVCEDVDPSDGNYHDSIAEFWGIDYEDAIEEARRAAHHGLELATEFRGGLPSAMVTVFFMGLYIGRAHAIPGLIEGIDPEIGLVDMPTDVEIPDSLPDDE